jgi:aminopeptidase C
MASFRRRKADVLHIHLFDFKCAIGVNHNRRTARRIEHFALSQPAEHNLSTADVHASDVSDAESLGMVHLKTWRLSSQWFPNNG